MTEPDDDIRERARELARAVRNETEGCACDSCIEAGAEVIDAALRAERARCARIAETWGEVNTSRHASTLQMKEMFATLDKGAKTLADSIAAAIRSAD